MPQKLKESRWTCMFLCKHRPFDKGHKKTLPSYRKRYWKNDISETSAALLSPSLSTTQGTNLSPAKVKHKITQFHGATIPDHVIVQYQFFSST